MFHGTRTSKNFLEKTPKIQKQRHMTGTVSKKLLTGKKLECRGSLQNGRKYLQATYMTIKNKAS